MRVDGLDEASVVPWVDVLRESERARAARFVFPRNRVEYIAAHVLARRALAAATGNPAAAFHFEAGTQGKPMTRLGDRGAGVHFNLSHTKGMVAVAVAPFELGLDVEPLDRSVNLSIAGRYFCPEEIAWLNALPEERQGEGFLRLWTLKEAFIKATGLGLTQALDSFWFEVVPPAIRFKAAIAEDPASWRFEQRDFEGRFMAAVGFRLPPEPAPAVTWWQVEPAALSAAIDPSVPVSRRPVDSAVARIQWTQR